AVAINSAGQVVVTGYKEVGKTDKFYRALVYDGKSFKGIGAQSGRSTAGSAINDSGWVVGMSYLKGSSTGRAFVYDGRAMKDLGTLEGGRESSASGINKQGHVVGTSVDASGKAHAFLYDGKEMKDLGTLGGNTSALAISDTGLVVGHSSKI